MADVPDYLTSLLQALQTGRPDGSAQSAGLAPAVSAPTQLPPIAQVAPTQGAPSLPPAVQNLVQAVTSQIPASSPGAASGGAGPTGGIADLLSTINRPMVANDHSTRNKWAKLLDGLGNISGHGQGSGVGGILSAIGGALYKDPAPLYQQALGQRVSQAVNAGIYDPEKLLPDFSDAAAHGVDIGPYAKMMTDAQQRAQLGAYVSSLPPDQRAAAAIDPQEFAKGDADTRFPKFENVGEGGALVGLNQRSGATAQLYSNPKVPDAPGGYRFTAPGQLEPIAGGPADPKVITARSAAEYDGRPDEATQAKIKSAIMQKVLAGQPLSAGEQQIWEIVKRNPLADLAALMGGGGVGGVAVGGSPASAAPHAFPNPKGLPYAATPGDAAKLGHGAHFIGPDGTERIRK